MAKRRLFGPVHIAVLVALAITLGAGANRCGKEYEEPKVCTSNALGERHCPLQTGRQDR